MRGGPDPFSYWIWSGSSAAGCSFCLAASSLHQLSWTGVPKNAASHGGCVCTPDIPPCIQPPAHLMQGLTPSHSSCSIPWPPHTLQCPCPLTHGLARVQTHRGRVGGVGHSRDKTDLPSLCYQLFLGIGASPCPFVLVVCLNLKEVSVPERAGLWSSASTHHGCGGFTPAGQEGGTQCST